MDKDRIATIEGIINAVDVMRLISKGESAAQAAVRFGDEEKVTIEEAEEVEALIKRRQIKMGKEAKKDEKKEESKAA